MSVRIVSAIARRLRRRVLGPLPDDPHRVSSCLSRLSINLDNRVALVTGATGELGRPIARTLASCGAKVALHFHTAEASARFLHDEFSAQGRSACIVSGDIADLAEVDAMRMAIESQLGTVDIVVGNAVTWFETASVMEQTADQYERVFRSCVLQSWTLARVFAEPMIAKGWGRFISLSSEVASQALANRSPYTAAKCAMDGMMRSLARELGPHGVTANQVAPGWVITDKDRRDRDEVQPTYERLVPLARRGYDQDVANVVAFLASDLACYLTGVRIPVCGGNVMHEA